LVLVGVFESTFFTTSDFNETLLDADDPSAAVNEEGNLSWIFKKPLLLLDLSVLL